jgi:2-polyprenyl-3-methyl-5-hydroxy-6-metoxy-1,4-benzoquinol methylase
MKKLKEKIYETYFSSHYSSLDEKQNSLVLLKNSLHGRQYIEFLPKEKDLKIIDLGCGTGSLVSGLINAGFSNVSGIDFSKENVSQGNAAGLIISQGEIEEFLKSSIEVDTKFDVIFLLDVLEHLDDEELYNILDKIYKSLTSSGTLIVKTINAESLISGMARYMDITHERSFTSHSIKELMTTFNFINLEILNKKLNKPKTLKNYVRLIIRKCWYYFIYKIVESREYPQCIDVDIVIKVQKG